MKVLLYLVQKILWWSTKETNKVNGCCRTEESYIYYLFALYFDLNKTIAVRRSLFLCHVYPTAEYDRGQYAFWGERRKKMLYKHGKQNYDSYAFPDAEFVGSYLDF